MTKAEKLKRLQQIQKLGRIVAAFQLTMVVIDVFLGLMGSVAILNIALFLFAAVHTKWYFQVMRDLDQIAKDIQKLQAEGAQT